MCYTGYVYCVWWYTRKVGDRQYYQGKVTNACYNSLLWGGGSIFAITRLGPISKFNFCNVHRQIITCISPDDSEGGGSLLNYNQLNEQTM